MPVEIGTGARRGHTHAIPESSSTELRKTFIEALQQGRSVRDVLTSLGIGQATYYKWKSLWQAHGESWRDGVQVTNAKRMSGLSVAETHNEIVAISLQRPKMGVKELAEYLADERGFNCAATTVHSILKANGVNTRQRRAERLHQKYLAQDDLTSEQLKLVKTIDAFADWPDGQAPKPGRVLMQNVIHLHHTAPLNRNCLHIVVDANDQRAFAMFPTNGGKTPEIQCLKLALTHYRKSGLTIEEVVTDNGHKYFGSGSGTKYGMFLKSQNIRHKFRNMTNNRRNPLVAAVWAVLIKYIYNDLRKECLENPDKPALLNRKIQSFLDVNFGDGLAL